MFLLKSLDHNGLMQKTKEQSLIALQKVLSPLPSILMSFSGSQNVDLLRRCGIHLK